jgi:drug/metabolite transporter (DMT)-like permease
MIEKGVFDLLNFAERNRKIALIEGMLAGASFGTAAIFIKLLGDLNVYSIAFWRLIIAICALGSIAVVSRKSFEYYKLKENIRQFIVLGILLGLHFILFVSAVADTTILNATVLVNTTPIFSMLISSFLFKVKSSYAAIIGILVSFLGVGIIAYTDSSPSALSIHLKGDLEAVLAAVVEGFYLNYGREVRGKVSLIPLMIAIYSMSALTVAVASVITLNPLPFAISQPSSILFLIGLGIVPTAFAHTFYFSSLSHLKSYETATMALLEPVGATLLGIAVFSEIPNLFFILGAALVLCGIFSVATAR